MTQVKKIYLSSFLKNQTYFVPIIVLFFQDLGLSYSQIFWIFTIGSAFAFLIEIPTGIFADVYGKRQSIIISKFLIFISFVAFGFSSGFWTLLVANLLYEFGKSFRSGTETAYVYNYLSENKGSPSYTLVKANQKFYARISEAIAAILGGLVASRLGFSLVFFLAALPAFVNFAQALTWEQIKEYESQAKKTLASHLSLARKALLEIWQSRVVRIIVFNFAIFTAAFFALEKFTQPYMKSVGIELQYFGFIYSAFLLLIAFLARYAYKLEEKFGSIKIMNYLSLISFIPLLILGLGYSAIWGVGLFFFVLMVENIRSPIANNLFHQNISSDSRATTGSILEMFKSSIRLIFLPAIGYLADFYSMTIAILLLSLVVLINGLVFWIPKNAKEIDPV
ncbi:MAG: MFS transporter [Patescibacteria group bacterium]|nr:MFS transporter [Patescibacteria group bacterium]